MPGYLGSGLLGSEVGFQACKGLRLGIGAGELPGAYLPARHFTAEHLYMSVLDNVERREHAEVYVTKASGAAVAAVELTFAGQPYSEIAIENGHASNLD